MASIDCGSSSGLSDATKVCFPAINLQQVHRVFRNSSMWATAAFILFSSISWDERGSFMLPDCLWPHNSARNLSEMLRTYRLTVMDALLTQAQKSFHFIMTSEARHSIDTAILHRDCGRDFKEVFILTDEEVWRFRWQIRSSALAN